jgi:mannose-1-phosphate guanylyltransferase/mannose-6-phosphate isomerase
MIVALIAGGAGTRLWPLSTPDYPKHLLTVTGEQSLLQMAYDRAKRMSDDIYIVTEASHAHHVKDQLADLKDEAFIVEPARRNTSGCFLAALVRAKRDHGDDEPIAITWADHYIRDIDGFVESFHIAAEASKKYCRPVLVGVEPTYATTGFGYIHKAHLLEGEQLVFEVEGFKEKPHLELAQEFFRSGEYLWNCGYLVGTPKALEKTMEADCPKLWEDYQKLLAAAEEGEDAYKQAYLELDSIQLDYTFHELAKNLLVVPGIFTWLDIGAFKDLDTVTESDEKGNSVIAEKGKVALIETENSYIRNDDEKPIAVVGVDNIVVVSTPAGILVARKDQSQKVKEALQQFKDE